MPTVPGGQFEYPEDNWAVGRMRRRGEVPEGVKTAGILDWFGYGKPEAKPTPEPGPRAVNYGAAKPMGEYPTDAEAESAKSYGFGYGTIHEPYIDQKTAKVFGEVRTQTVPGAKGKTESRFVSYTPEGQTITSLMNHILDKGKSVNIDLTKPEFKEVKDKIGHAYTKAALAVEGNPIAKLGYDPSLVTSDVSGAKTNLSGAFGSQKHGYQNEGIYANLTDPSVLVHESIHRGLDQLVKRNPEAQKVLDKLPVGAQRGGHELLVRYMMNKFAGDPEKYAPSGAKDPQRDEAVALFEDKHWGKQHRETVDKLMDIAAQEVAKKRPGGPR